MTASQSRVSESYFDSTCIYILGCYIIYTKQELFLGSIFCRKKNIGQIRCLLFISPFIYASEPIFDVKFLPPQKCALLLYMYVDGVVHRIAGCILVHNVMYNLL